MDYDMNIRDYPEKHGLHIVDDLEFGGSYEFDTHIVFKHTDGRVFYAHDSGCSCPHPFEDFNSLEDLEQITIEGFDSFSAMIMNLDDGTIGEKNAFLRKVESALDN